MDQDFIRKISFLVYKALQRIADISGLIVCDAADADHDILTSFHLSRIMFLCLFRILFLYDILSAHFYTLFHCFSFLLLFHFPAPDFHGFPFL